MNDPTSQPTAQEPTDADRQLLREIMRLGPAGQHRRLRLIRAHVADAVAKRDAEVCVMLANPTALRTHVLRYGPPGYDIYTAEQIERIKAEVATQAGLYQAKKTQFNELMADRDRMSLARNAAAVIDEWIKDGAGVSDPSLGVLQMRIGYALTNLEVERDNLVALVERLRETLLALLVGFNERNESHLRTITADHIVRKALALTPESAGNELAAATERAEKAEAEVARLDPGVHSCGPDCQRPMCVLRRENAELRESLTDFRYSHDEIEAACGGEIAMVVRKDVMKRRAAIDAGRQAEARKGQT